MEARRKRTRLTGNEPARLQFPPAASYHNCMNSTYDFDILVIGGGHAGTEAAVAAARMRDSDIELAETSF